MTLPPPREIALLEEARLARSVSALAPVSEAIAGGVMCRAEPGSWMNKAINLGMGGEVSAGDIAALMRFYEGGGIEPRVEVCPYSHGTLVRGLADAGFGLRRLAHVLVADLHGGPPATPTGGLAGLTFRVIDPRDDEGRRLLARTAHRGFVAPDSEPTDAQVRVWLGAMGNPATMAVLATIDGEPASAGYVDVHGAYATLYAASVVPAFRRRGVQGAMIAERMRLARERGAEFATITSDPEGPTERNARRLGFVSCYTRMILTRPGVGLAGVA
jgi:GNAT superfamily N-acetyltransferase